MIEMKRIDSLALRPPRRPGWATSDTFYSKRSFLRDTVAARPELASGAPSPRRGCKAGDLALAHTGFPANSQPLS